MSIQDERRSAQASEMVWLADGLKSKLPAMLVTPVSE